MNKKLKLLISFISVFLILSVVACSVFVIVDIKRSSDNSSSTAPEGWKNESSYSESIEGDSDVFNESSEETSSEDSSSEESSEVSSSEESSEVSSSEESSDLLPPHVHQYLVNKTVKPNCLTSGYTLYKCSCGESYKTNEIAALGHKFGTWKTIKEPTTEAEGKKERSCSRCGEKETKQIEKLPKPEPKPESKPESQPESKPEPPINPSESYLYILGTSVFSAEDLANYVLRYKGRDELKINCSIEELAAFYISEGAAEGIRGDIAFCQAIWETGWFTFGGSVKPDRNNYCGLGAIDNTAGGEKFETPQIGVRAHIQHLKAYCSVATENDLAFPCVDTRYNHAKTNVIEKGYAKTWIDLGGRWAQPGYDTSAYNSLEEAIAAEDSYGHKIISKYQALAGIS